MAYDCFYLLHNPTEKCPYEQYNTADLWRSFYENIQTPFSVYVYGQDSESWFFLELSDLM